MTRAALGFGLALLAVAGVAGAQEPDAQRIEARHAEARATYERGTRAFNAKDFALAAREFARADAIVPSNAALEAALEASLLAGDPVLGVQLAERASGRPTDERARAVAEKARAAFGARVARVILPCAPPASCRATIDGIEVERPSAPVVVAPGRRMINVVRVDAVKDFAVELTPGQTVTLTLPSGPDEPMHHAGDGGSNPDSNVPLVERTSGFGKFMTWTAAGLTVALAAGSTISYFDLRSQRRAFERGACGEGAIGTPAVDCDSRANRGEAAELRTGILVGATGALALTTAAFLVFRPWTHRVAVDVSSERAAVLFGGKLP